MNLASLAEAAGSWEIPAGAVAMEPGGGSVPLDEEGGLALRLHRRGIWEIRPPGQRPDHPPALAVNVDVAESDLTRMDVEAFQAAVGGAAALVNGSGRPDGTGETEEVAGEDFEKSQAFWRYLMAAAFLLMASETMLSNRLSRERIKEGEHAKDRQPAL